MASFGLFKLNGEIIELPSLKFVTVNNGGSTTIQCNVGDYLVTECFNTAASSLTVNSGGTLIGSADSYGPSLIRCTATSLQITWSGASYNTGHGLLISSPKSYTSITKINNTSDYTNVPQYSIFYGRADSNPTGTLYLENGLIYACENKASANMNPIAGYIISSSNKLSLRGNALLAAYIS